MSSSAVELIWSRRSRTISGLSDSHAERKNIVLAATKADLYDEQYRRQTGRDPYDIGNIAHFRQFVTEEMRRQSNIVSHLLEEIDSEFIHPVYFRTVEDDGNRVPVVTEEGDLQPFGFVELQEQLK